MAEGLNRVMLLGNLGADPELRVTTGGQAVLKLRLATNESYLDKNQVRQERVEWHRVTVWGRRAEGLAKFVRKGFKLFVEGRIQTSTYEKNGEKRYSTDIVAINIIVASNGEGGGGRSGGGSDGGGRSSVPSNPSDADEGFEGGGNTGGGAGGQGDDIPF
jgi:single-strand DNA-binding protein